MLIVEDGSVVRDAESYIDTAFADAYFLKRGNPDWMGMVDDHKEQAIFRAMVYFSGRYAMRWKGCRVSCTQELDWPRSGVVIDGVERDYRVIPKEIKNAIAELALRAASGPLVEDQERLVIQETVGPITTKYDEGSSAAVRYTEVDDMLRVYLRSGRGNIRLSRV